MQIRNISFGEYPVGNIQAGQYFEINEKFHDPKMHGVTRMIKDTEMLPNGFKRVRYKDGDKPVETYEYSPTEQKDILKFLDLIV